MYLLLPFVAIFILPWIPTLVSAQGTTQATFSIFANASDINPEPTSVDCANALASVIDCSSDLIVSLPSSTVAISNLTESNLTALCNSTCFQSLNDIINAVDSNCAGWPYILGSTKYIASLPFRYLAYTWNLTCVTGSTATSTTVDFCLLAAQQSTSVSDVDITTLPPSQLCTGCNLSPLDIQMNSPFGWDANFVSNWTQIQQTCGVSFGNNIPSSLVLNSSTLQPNATSVNITASPTLSPASTTNCVFGSYTVKSGDSCSSIAASKSLSYDQLIGINGLDINCTKLPPAGQAICLSGACSVYTVQANDTCVNIAEAHGITWAQLLSWNPQLNTYCSNIDSQVGKGICVGPPGGGYTPTATVLPISLLPTATALAIPTAPVAPGADRANCGLWYTAVPGDTCPQILSIFQLTNDTFYELNPLVNSDCSNLLAGFAYCVQVFGNFTTTTAISTPTSTGATLLQVFSGEFPQGTGFVTGGAQNLTATAVTGLPTVSTPSSTATPSPTYAPGTITTGCFQYYVIQPGDTCLAITVQFDITQDELVLWNTGINAGCSNLIPGQSLCVYSTPIFTTPTFVPPTSSSTSTTTTSSPAVSPTAPGTITSGCTEYYTVVSGDFCAKIDDMFGITFAQFQAWNPEVDTACDNIQAGLQYCVAGPPIGTSTTTTSPAASPTAPGTITSGCIEYYTVVSGDFCQKIEDMFNITFAQFQAWNPEVDNACDNIDVGLQYCVSGPAVP